jgi:hypothetical protein
VCACYNGQIPPNYVTKPIKHTEPVEHGAKKEKKKKDKKTRSATPKLVKAKEKNKDRESNAAGLERNNLKKNANRFISHGVVGTNYLSALGRRYGMDFTPYLLQIEVKLYFGSTLLKCNAFGNSNKIECIVKSRMIPFSFAPKWFEWLEFKGKLKLKNIILALNKILIFFLRSES